MGILSGAIKNYQHHIQYGGENDYTKYIDYLSYSSYNSLMRKHHVFVLLLLISLLLPTRPYSLLANEDESAISLAGDGTIRRLRVPILMYHYVGELPYNADDIRTNLTLSPQLFQEHIQYLNDEGYSTISLYEMDAALATGSALPEKPIILTFDDGYIDHYRNVFPVLQEYGFTGTFFIATEFIDNNAPGYMNWSQVTEMAAAGMSMEAHTKNHVDLRNRSYDYLVYQVMGSIESLSEHTGGQSSMFAYPVGRYDENTLDVIATTPVLRAVTTQRGIYHTTDNRYEVPRLRISNGMGVAGLIQTLKTE